VSGLSHANVAIRSACIAAKPGNQHGRSSTSAQLAAESVWSGDVNQAWKGAMSSRPENAQR
jgi:hypothetical protein